MSKRDYNVFFNAHTVSGILISIGLFVIFFAGAFALFLESINHWENNTKHAQARIIDYDKVLADITSKGYDMHGRSVAMYSEDNTVVARSRMLADSTLQKNKATKLPDSVAQGSFFFKLNPDNYQKNHQDETGLQGSLGTFLYELHFFEQIPTVGRYLAGLISIFFLFAILTGVIVHWKKIISNFFTFHIKVSAKNLWTDAHTALGFIGLPFQMMYAVTGTVFCLLFLLVLPMAEIVYQGDQEAMYNDIYPSFAEGPPKMEGYNSSIAKLNESVQLALSKFAGEPVKSIYAEVHNYHDSNAYLELYVETYKIKGVFNYAKFVYRLRDNMLLQYKPIDATPSYAIAVWDLIHIIHFGNFGGTLLKVLYFIMALITCFVILTGVMIWLEARNNSKYAHKAKFNQNTGAIFIGICMGLYPAVALLFCLVKLFPNNFKLMSNIFFMFWLGFSVFAFFLKRPFHINRLALILAGTFGLLIPVLNGLGSRLWFWKSLQMGYLDSFTVDVGWLLMASLTLVGAYYAKPVAKNTSSENRTTKKSLKINPAHISVLESPLNESEH